MRAFEKARRYARHQKTAWPACNLVSSIPSIQDLPSVSCGHRSGVSVEMDLTSIRRKLNSPGDGTLASTLIPIVPFHRPRCFPVKIDVLAQESLHQCSAFVVRLPPRGLQILVDQYILVSVRATPDRSNNSIVESLQLRLLQPPLLNSRQIHSRPRTPLPPRRRRRLQHIHQRHHPLPRRPQHKLMIPPINRRRNQRRSLGVRPPHHHQLRPHHIRLRAARNQPINMLAHRHHDFPAHVPALLRAGRLVLDVDARRAGLDEELGQLHRRGDAAVARVGVGDDGAEEVGVRRGTALGGGCG